MHLEIRSNLAECFIWSSIFCRKPFFWANVNSTYDIILSYLVKNSIQRNMNRRGDKRMGAGQQKLLSFTKITKEMNQ